VDWFVVEVGKFDAACPSQLEDLGGAGDPRQVRPVAYLSPVAFELREKLFCLGNFVL
jgi:hypothetical protein